MGRQLSLALLACLSLAGEEPTRLGEAKPWPADRLAADWPQLLGPSWTGRTPETITADEPRAIWLRNKGDSYAMPIAAAGKVWLYHHVDGEDLLDCCAAETGALLWQDRAPSSFRDRFGYGTGPRASPVAAEGGRLVLTLSAEGRLRCVQGDDGRLVWERLLHQEHSVPAPYFGVGGGLLVQDGRVIINLGAFEGPAVIAYDLDGGAELWRSQAGWGASYACPIPLAGKLAHAIAILAGGVSDPPDGGALVMDASNGEELGRHPFRSHLVHSVNAASPLAVGEGALLLSASYGSGSVLLDLDRDGVTTLRWHSDDLGSHWATPLVEQGLIVGCDGRERDAALVGLDPASGISRWRAKTLPHGNHELGPLPLGRCQLIGLGEGLLCLSEDGLLAWLDCRGEAPRCRAAWRLFQAPQTWSAPCLSRGLLFVAQNSSNDEAQGPCWRAYDLR